MKRHKFNRNLFTKGTTFKRFANYFHLLVTLRLYYTLYTENKIAHFQFLQRKNTTIAFFNKNLKLNHKN
jgi:hypothetical protein